MMGSNYMNIYVLFAQGKYEGCYPEALDVISEIGMDENPDYLENKKAEYIRSNDYVSVAIIPINISNKDIDQRLGLNQPPITGVICK